MLPILYSWAPCPCLYFNIRSEIKVSYIGYCLYSRVCLKISVINFPCVPASGQEWHHLVAARPGFLQVSGVLLGRRDTALSQTAPALLMPANLGTRGAVDVRQQIDKYIRH